MTFTRRGSKKQCRTRYLVIAAGVALALSGVGTAAAQNNTKFGVNALVSNTGGQFNSAFGYQALQFNTAGFGNTACGASALQHNLTGNRNTASGDSALRFNTTGEGNTATGVAALENNTDGFQNTASGDSALQLNLTGNANTASGFSALLSNVTGNDNTASGFAALQSNTEGNANTASGSSALQSNTDGFYDTASGFNALQASTTGVFNTATGAGALQANTTGHGNVAVGAMAGFEIQTGSENIDIGVDVTGTAGESDTIRIGRSPVQTRTFIAGINGAHVTGADVVVTSNGQLGIVASSARFKRDIRDMGDASQRLMELRPVTFRYKNDQSGTIQYGLVAEEVARVYPELVTYGADGKVETVRYSELTGMLLNELQKQTGQAQKISAQVRAQQKEIADLKADRDREHAQRTAFEARLSALERTIEASNGAGRLSAAFNN